MNLKIPHSVILSDGTTAQVKGVAARVIDGQLAQIVYTVEKETGAWTEIDGEEIHLEKSRGERVAPFAEILSDP